MYKTLKTKKQFYISEIIKLIMMMISVYIFGHGIDINNLFLSCLGIGLIAQISRMEICFFNYNFYCEEWKNELLELLNNMKDIEKLLLKKEII